RCADQAIASAGTEGSVYREAAHVYARALGDLPNARRALDRCFEIYAAKDDTSGRNWRHVGGVASQARQRFSSRRGPPPILPCCWGRSRLCLHCGVTMMQIRSFNAPSAPQGFHAQVCAVEGATRLAFVSGQVPATAEGAVPESLAEQSRLIWRNIEAQLAE